MAVMTPHALEAFPSMEGQWVGAGWPIVKPSRRRPFVDQVENLRLQRMQMLDATSLMKNNPHRSSFERKGPTWVAATKLQSDLQVEVDDMSFHLHKFPLLSRSGHLNRLVFESRDTEKDHIKLDDMPGGPGAFELAVKFCYGIPITITPTNVAALRCVAEYLEMTEDLEEGNLISKTKQFLASHVLASWKDSITVLRTCERLLPWAENVHIVKMCSESIAWKACTDPRGIRWSYSREGESSSPPAKWDRFVRNVSATKHIPHDWWFSDLASLNLVSFRKVMDAIKEKGMKPDLLGSAIFYYAQKCLPGLSRGCVSSFEENSGSPAHDDKSKQKENLEEIVRMLPPQQHSVSVSSVLKLLGLANVLDVCLECKKELQQRAGTLLDQATVSDLLIGSPSHSSDEHYDVDLVHRCVDCFLVQDHIRSTSEVEPSSSGRDKDTDVYDGNFLRPSVARHTGKMMKVAKLVDGYLAEIARDSKLPYFKFLALAEALPEFSRATDDGLYRAIDTYLKTHPRLTEQERKKLCRMMDFQRLSLEACMHASQNERLPLRIVVQVLCSEQTKLRSAIVGSTQLPTDHTEGLSQQQNPLAPSQQASFARVQSFNETSRSQMEIRALRQDVMIMKTKIAELQRDCSAVSHQVEKLIKDKGHLMSWTHGWRRRLFHPKGTMDSSSPVHQRSSLPWRNSIA